MKIETKYDIASSVNVGAEYDKGVKKLFKSKEIIVLIMEMVIPEFEGCSQEEILNWLDLASITSDEVVSDAPVSETDEYRIRGEDTELSGGSDKLIRFDSKFRIRNPKLSEENILVNLHIDLEGQKSYTPEESNLSHYKKRTLLCRKGFEQSAWSDNWKDKLCRSGEVLFNLDLSGGCTGKIKEYNDRIPNKERRYSGRDGRTGRRL
ncbi:MAG: hypothetical protein ACLUO9_04290 [Coprococcus comes]